MKKGYKIAMFGIIPIVFATGIFGLNVESSLEINDKILKNQIDIPESKSDVISLKKYVPLHEKNIKYTGDELCLTGTITRIVDGDTIYLDGIHEIRLSLTNTPERHEIGFYDASRFTAEICPVGSQATVDQDDKQPYDVYNRMLGKITCGGKILNAELLYENHANILNSYCPVSEFSDETWAQEFGC